MDNQFGTVHGCELFCSRIRTTVIILVNVAIHCYGNALSIWYYKLCTKDLVLGNLHFCIIDRVFVVNGLSRYKVLTYSKCCHS